MLGLDSMRQKDFRQKSVLTVFGIEDHIMD